MIKRILTVAMAWVLLSTGSAMAQTEESVTSSDDDAEILGCYDYNRYGQQAQYYCQQDFNCSWTARGCVERQQRPQRCENIRDYYQCQQYGCFWDQRYGCSSRQQPQPQRCEYVRDYNQCVRSGCFWDQRYGCTSRQGPGPGRDVWQCTARDQGWEEHPGGHSAQGGTQWEAQQAALQICQRPYGPHDRCTISSCQRIR